MPIIPHTNNTVMFRLIIFVHIEYIVVDRQEFNL